MNPVKDNTGEHEGVSSLFHIEEVNTNQKGVFPDDTDMSLAH